MNTESRSKKELPNPAKNEEAHRNEEVKTLPLPIITFEVNGEPVAKGRPRVGKFGTYTPKKTIVYENWVRECFISNYPGHSPVEYDIKANIICYHSIPKSKSQKIKIQMEQGHIRPSKKPDIDNIIKAITDSLNQLAYKDDSQIIEVTCKKFYSERPRVEVTLEKLGGDV